MQASCCLQLSPSSSSWLLLLVLLLVRFCFRDTVCSRFRAVYRLFQWVMR